MMSKLKTVWMLVLVLVLSQYDVADEIHEAVEKGDLAAIRALLEKNPALLNRADRYTLSPLHWAALTGQRDVAELLLARGANINQKTRLAQTPLHIAIQHNNKDMMKFLKEKGADQSPWRWPVIQGDYLGEEKPGLSAKLFSPEIVSSILWDHGAPAFNRDVNEVYWAVVFEDDLGMIVTMKRKDGRWSEIKSVSFSESRFRDVSPILSKDEKKLYFTSCRPTTQNGKSGGYNIWVSERGNETWSEPRLLAPEIASGKDGRPCFAKDGTMYFGSGRPGSIRGWNIYRAGLVNGKFSTPERIPASFNTANAVPTYIAPDESYLIFESFRPGGLGNCDFWISFHGRDGGWGEAINLGAPINSKGNDWLGGYSPDRKYFFFGSDREGNSDYYWIDAKVIEKLRPKSLK